MPRVVLVALLAVGVVHALACNALTGVGDLSEDGASTLDGGARDALPFVTPPLDAGADSAPPADAGAPPRCPSAGNTCAPAPPAGWDGPFLAYEGDRAAAPACPAESPALIDANTGAPTGSITCSDCRCGNVEGAACTTTSLSIYAAPSCTNTSLITTEPFGSACKETASAPYVSARLRVAISNAGSCDQFVPTSGKQKSAIVWPTVLRLCGRPSPFGADGCGAGELCVPAGAAPFKPRVCIASSDPSAECAAPWTEPHPIYGDDSVTDTRDCSTTGCSCAAPRGVSCSGRVRNFAAAACAGTAAGTFIENQCFATAPGSSQRVDLTSLAASGGSCEASGTPTATGSVTKGAPVGVVCCLP